MAEKDTLLSDKNLMNLASKLRPSDLMPLALNLGFNTPEIEHIQAKSPLDTKLQIYYMLWTWREKEDVDSIVVDALCKALENIGRKALSLDFKPKGTAGQSLDTVSTSQKPQWERLASKLGFCQSRIAYFKQLGPGNPEKQTWHMLMDWRGKHSSHEARTTELCHALETIGRRDLAHEIQGLSDKILHKISEKLFDVWEDLAIHLGLRQPDINQINEKHSNKKQRVFNVLIQCRNRQSTKEDAGKVLCRALQEVGREGLAEELRKDWRSLVGGLKRLRKLAYMLTLEPDSNELLSENYHIPTQLIINNQDDLRSLCSDLRDADTPLEVEVLILRCRSLEELGLRREILHSKNLSVSGRLELRCSLSDKWKEELQCLEEKLIQSETKFPTIYQVLHGDADDDAGYDMEYVGRCIRNISDKLHSKFAITMNGMIRSGSDVQILGKAMKGCKLYAFGCPEAKLHGHLAHLAPLITSCLQTLLLNNCNLTDDDIPDLVRILPVGYGLIGLDVESNKFTLAGVAGLTAHLKKLPKLSCLRIDCEDLEAHHVKQVVLQNLPHMKENEMGFFETY